MPPGSLTEGKRRLTTRVNPLYKQDNATRR